MTLSLSNILRVKMLDLFRGTNQLKTYNEYLKNQFRFTRGEIELYQEKKFREIYNFHYHNNPTYRNLVDQSGFDSTFPFNTQSIPLLTKAFFKQNQKQHVVKKEIIKTKRSGGSTGIPMTYYLSKESFESVWPALWRAFDIYDIQPCDRTMLIAGPSLFSNRSMKRKIYDYINRFTVVSAFDLSDATLEKAYQNIRTKKIEVLYGYTSSILIFLQFLKRHHYRVNLKVIFTTSETFIPSVRT